jgi:hypothetical protein
MSDAHALGMNYADRLTLEALLDIRDLLATSARRDGGRRPEKRGTPRPDPSHSEF